MSEQVKGSGRREFMTSTAVAAAGAALLSQIGSRAHAAGQDEIRVGLIGCGGRGTGAGMNAVESSPNVKIVAMADLFEDRMKSAWDSFKKQGQEVAKDKCYVGFDGYQKLIADPAVNYVICATPPGFRSIHILAAVNAGKNVFCEKPVAVDGPTARECLEAYKISIEKKLGIAAGTQRRHQFSYQETIKRIHDGYLGDILAARCYWNMGGLWIKDRDPKWSDMETQIRNWLYYTWASGDHICEQHVHNLDVINWVLKDHPTQAHGMGGRQVRTDPKYGHIFDHFAVEYSYPNNVHVLSECRQIDGCEGNVSEFIVGTKGKSNPGGHIEGEKAWKYTEKAPNPYVQEHADLIASIRKGEPINELKQVTESTLTAIMGRMSAYTGRIVKWNEVLNSKTSLRPEKWEFGDLAVPPVAVPGKTKII